MNRKTYRLARLIGYQVVILDPVSQEVDIKANNDICKYNNNNNKSVIVRRIADKTYDVGSSFLPANVWM